MKKIEQTELPLKIVHRCKMCGRPISKYGYGEKCKAKIIGNFVINVPADQWKVVFEFLKKEIK